MLSELFHRLAGISVKLRFHCGLKLLKQLPRAILLKFRTIGIRIHADDYITATQNSPYASTFKPLPAGKLAKSWPNSVFKSRPPFPLALLADRTLAKLVG